MENRSVCLGDQVTVATVFGVTGVGQVIGKAYDDPVRFDVVIGDTTMRDLLANEVTVIEVIEGAAHG